MPRLKGVQLEIARAERVLPGRAVRTGIDRRQKALVELSDYIETDPIPVCEFALKWIRWRGRDLQEAIKCCLFEPLLERQFDVVLPLVRAAAREDSRVAKHFVGGRDSMFLFGQAKAPKNLRRLKRLEGELRRLHPELGKPGKRKASSRGDG